MTYCAFDTETDLIGPETTLPEIVCASFASRDIPNDLVSTLVGQGDDLKETITVALASDLTIVGHSVAYDMGCVCANWPDMIPLVFKKYLREEIIDTKIREQLINLGTSGNMRMTISDPDGEEDNSGAKGMPISYHLSDLSFNYLGKDRSADKNDEDAWRLRYNELKGMKAADYPEGASSYALEDATDTLLICELQDERIEELGIDLLKVDAFRAAADFMLKLITEWGMLTDPVKRREIEDMLERELHPSKLQKVTEAGIVIPAKSSVPFKKQIDAAIVIMVQTVPNIDEDDLADRIESCTLLQSEINTMEEYGIKMKKGAKSKISTQPLKDLITKLCKANDIEIEETPTGNVAAGAEIISNLLPYDDSGVLEEFQHREKLQKLVTTEIPRLSAPLVRFNFNVLVNTGRTSSFAGDLYPSMNGQNADPRIRNILLPRNGNVFLSVDYSGIELCSFAQKCLDIFGQSTLADLINGGKDPHAYLGAQIANSQDADFQNYLKRMKPNPYDRDNIYEFFRALKIGNEEDRAFFKNYRTLAKPTGLGFPGGLGAKTFVTYAKATYGVDITIEEAKALKEIWLEIIPEASDYFNWVTNRCEDPMNGDKFSYTTPLGMVRAGASYCATCNGAALQSPTAEGALGAGFHLVRACMDPTAESILYGCHVSNFVHDEYIFEIPEDEYMHERACEVDSIMVSSMRGIIRDVDVKTEAALMRRWDKRAEPVFDESGRLSIWEEE